MGGVRLFLRRNSKKIIFLSCPILLLPVPVILQSKTGSCAYGLLLMAIFWITEALPLAVTALLPIFLFPLLGVSKVNTLASKYTNNIIFVLIGGLSVAIAIERWNVHKRIALRLLLLMGSQPKWLMLGFMVITCFLSMWVSNTATTAMMIPIAQAVLVQLMETKHKHLKEEEKDVEKAATETMLTKDMLKNGGRVDSDVTQLNDSNRENVEDFEQPEKTETEYSFDYESLDPSSKMFCKAFCLSICYASNCGGIGTLTGTGPNLVMKGQADLMSDGQSVITFTSWFIFGFPIAVVTCLISWLVIQIYFFGVKAFFSRNKEDSTKVQDVIRMEYNKLGDITFAEKAVFFHFVVLVLLWFSREPEFFPGWGSFFEHGYLGDSVPAVMIMISLFIFPSRRREKDSLDDFIEVPSLLDWKTVAARMPWGVALLMGGGFALAKACTDSGLSLWLADQMSAIKDINTWSMVFVISLISSFATEVTSNTAISTLILPILAELAIGIGKNPIYIMLPATLSTSFAFMLPVATPPNTLAFSYGYLKVIDMVKVGFILNSLCVVVVTVVVNTWGIPFYKLDEFPDWAEKFLKTSIEITTSLPDNATTNINTTM